MYPFSTPPIYARALEGVYITNKAPLNARLYRNVKGVTTRPFDFMNTKLLIISLCVVFRKRIFTILLHYHTKGMLKTKQQFTKFIEKNPEGSVFVYAQKDGGFMFIIFQTGVIEYANKGLVDTLLKEKILYPMLCHSVDRNKLKEKEGIKGY